MRLAGLETSERCESARRLRLANPARARIPFDPPVDRRDRQEWGGAQSENRDRRRRRPTATGEANDRTRHERGIDMIQLSITPEEGKRLGEMLAEVLSELGYEIANTDSHDFRIQLREKQSLLKRVVEELGVA